MAKLINSGICWRAILGALLLGILSFPRVGFGNEFPQRIISLGPGITEELYLLQAGDRIVGVTTYCHRPEEAGKKDKVGTILEVNLEEIVVRKPDLVLATPLTDPRAIEKLKSLGIRVHQFPLARNFSELNRQFLELGRLIGKAGLAEEAVARAEGEVSRIQETLKGRPRIRVFIQVGAQPLFAANRDYFLNDLIELAGGINPAREAPGGGLYSLEKVVEDNPDVIIIATMGLAGQAEKTRWENLAVLKAARNKRIYVVDPDRFCNPTPVTFGEAFREMIRILYPDVSG